MTTSPTAAALRSLYVAAGGASAPPLPAALRRVRLPFSTRSACVSAEIIEMIDETPIRPVSIAIVSLALCLTPVSPARRLPESR